MEERVEDDPQAAEHHLLLLPVDTRDPERLARQELRREVAERDNDLRPDQLDLVEEMAFARLDLLRERIAVPRRPAFEHVRDEDVPACEADARQQLAEQL